MKTIKLGNKVMVSDPCYRMGTWCQGVLDDVLPGNYNCTIEYSDEGEWGVRVAAIEVVHESVDSYWLELADFVIGVDSGQAGIFDYEYYAEHHSDRELDDEWYKTVCHNTWADDEDGTIDGRGFVSISGYGDGSYPCYVAYDADDRIVAIRVEYIWDDEEDN